MLKNNKAIQIICEGFLIIVASVLSAVGLYVFVKPADFAPSGIDGVSIMVQNIFGINMGYVSLAINLPLLAIAYFFINKKYVIYTTIFTIMSSLTIIAMEKFSMYEYVSENNVWVAVLASGIILGIRTAVMIKIGGSSGGVDIIACLIQKKKPYLNIESLISAFCYIIIAISFFVYGNLESVIMSVAQMIVFNTAMSYMLKNTRNAVEVHIITDDVKNLREDILKELKHGATIIDCKGMFTDSQKQMVVTIINIHQMSDLIKISKKYADSFMYYSDVNGVLGNFRWNKFDEIK